MDHVNNGCPTAVLVDVSPPMSHNYASSNTLCFKEGELDGCKFMNRKNPDSKEKIEKILNYAHESKTGDSLYSSSLCEVENQVSVKKSSLQTPSPQSMSCISKEASKVVDHLHSSSIYDEDLLLVKEEFPIPFNFDELDDDADQHDSSDDVFVNAVLDSKASVCVQSLNKPKENNENLSSHSSTDSPVVENNLKQTLLEKNLSKINFSFSVKDNGSCNNSDSLIRSDEADDVFDVVQITSEDKENMQDRKKMLVRKETMENQTSTKNLSVNKSKFYQRGTLKNLSNIKPEFPAKHISFSKSVTTPLKKMSISTTNTRKIQLSTEKPQLRKTTSSVDSHHSLKTPSLSNPFRFQNTKDKIPSVRKAQLTTKIDSACSSISSDIRQQNVFATPSRRYSICTPLKSTSVIKPPLTPAITSLRTFAYTPQPAGPSRLSFSRSWQQPVSNSQFFAAKGHKQEIGVPTSTSKIPLDFKNSSSLRRLSFSQSLSAVPVRSSGKNIATTSSKVRFASKLNLPSTLTPKQDKNLVRALFTNASEK